MLGPSVEAKFLVRLREQLCERARGGRVGRALLGLVLAVGRGLADRDQCLRAAGLDPGVAGGGELRVGGRADDLALLVELRRQEVAEVGLVPDPVEAHEREAGAAAVVAGREGSREVLEVGHLRGEEGRPLAAVRPLRRAPDRHQYFHPSLLRVAHELVQVGKAVGGIERVGGAARPGRRDTPPLDERAHDRRVRGAHLVELGQPVGPVAEHGVVMEADPHPVLRRGGAGGEREDGGSGDEHTGENEHEEEPPGRVAEPGEATRSAGSRYSQPSPSSSASSRYGSEPTTRTGATPSARTSAQSRSSTIGRHGV